MRQVVTTAVLPVAGLGTRIMPLTLHQPKAMVGIVDRPMIHYAVNELSSAGINHVVIIHGPRQRVFKNYVRHFQKEGGWPKIRFDFVLQKNPVGNADAIYLAKKFIKNSPFLVSFSDDLLDDTKPPIQTLISLFNRTLSPVLMLDSIPSNLAQHYGVVKIEKTKINKNLYQILDVVEKPSPKEAPSNFTIIGRYVLTPKLLEYIEALRPTKIREAGLADALKNYAVDGHELYGWHFQGKRFDTGSKMGILGAQVYFGLRHPQLGSEFKKYLKKLGIKKDPRSSG